MALKQAKATVFVGISPLWRSFKSKNRNRSYYDTIHPCERDVVRGLPTDKLLRLLCKNKESLTATLTEKQKEIFIKFKDC